MGIHSIERRKNPRAYIEVLTLIAHPSIKSSMILGWIHNISFGGAGVIARIPSSFRGFFQEGDKIQFRTREDYFEFHGSGKVAWTSPPGNMVGIKFGQLSQECKEALEELLRLFPSFSVSIP